MTRFNQLADQYFDPLTGGFLVNGFIKFEVSGGGTDKNTYADDAETPALVNANPVPLSATGIPPNIFFTGEAKAILLRNDLSQIRVLDPVPGGASALDSFASWSATITYSLNDIVSGDDDRNYISIGNANINHNPTSTTGFWMEVRFINVWNTAYTFSAGAIAQASDGNLYRAITSVNLGNDPISSPTNWFNLTAGGDLFGPASSTDNALARFDLATGKLQQNSVAILDDSGNLTGIGTLASGTHTIGTLVLAAASITDTSGAISFGDENLTTTGTLASGDYTIADGKIAITDTTNETVLSITSSSTNQNVFRVTADSLTTARAIFALTDSASFSSGNGLISSIVDNTSASGTGIVSQQDGTGFSYVGNVAGVIKFQVDGPDGDVNNTNGTYGTISDRKTKENITEGVRSYTDDFLNLQYHRYQRKDDLEIEEEGGRSAPWLLGLVADEVSPIFPGCVKDYLDTEEVVIGQDQEGDITESRPILDSEGNQTVTQAVKSSIIDGTINSIVLQEQIKELRALKAELKAAGVIA